MIMLWIAFKFVSLHYATQLIFYLLSLTYVVNCFQICIFALCNTTLRKFDANRIQLWIAFKFVSLHYATQQKPLIEDYNICCELLSNLYLCTMQHNLLKVNVCFFTVVNCFQICIFALCNTTCLPSTMLSIVLWIAFKFVSLHYATQLY